MSKTNIEDNVLVFPNTIHFQEDRQGYFKDDYIIISSSWLGGIAFQITTPYGNFFDIPTNEGFIPPCESKKIPISIHQNANIRQLSCTFSVNIAEANERDLREENPKAFWRIHSKLFTKTLPCEVLLRDSSLSIAGHSEDARERFQNDDESSLPKGRILDLMIKNVSKGNPLTEQETEELKSIRSVMTKEKWTAWLKYAREEKKKRQVTPPQQPGAPFVSSLSQFREESEFIQASQAAVQTAYQYQTNDLINTIESSRTQPPARFFQTPSRPPPSLQSPAFSFEEASQNSSAGVPNLSQSRPRGHASSNDPPSAQPRGGITSVSYPPPPLIPPQSQVRHPSIVPPPPPIIQQTGPPSSQISQPFRNPSVNIVTPALGESFPPKRSSIPSPPSFAQPVSTSTQSSPTNYSHTVPQVRRTPSPEKYPNRASEQFRRGIETESGPQTFSNPNTLRINHRMSAPAERMSEPGRTIVSMYQDEIKPKPTPTLNANHRPSAQFQSHRPLQPPDSRKASSPLRSLHPSNDTFAMESTIERISGLESRETPARKQYSQQKDQTQPPQVDGGNPPDVVKSSALRIDSAYAAAQSLKASIEADLETGSTNSEKASSTLAMVEAMLASLEKSRHSLNSLSNETLPKKSVNSTPQTQKPRLSPGKVQQYENILSKLENFPSEVLPTDEQENSVAEQSPPLDQNPFPQLQDDDQRFDSPQGSEYDYPTNQFKTNSARNLVSGPGKSQNQRWSGESIGIRREFDEETQSEISAIEASDWPPPAHSRVVTNTAPKRGFIPASDRLRPTSAQSAKSQRSLSTSRIDSQRGHRQSVVDREEPFTPNYSFDDGESGLYSHTESSSRKRLPNQSTLQVEQPIASHYFLKSRHGSSRPGTAANSINVTKKSIDTVRMAKGMPRVVRLCLSHGPMIKTYDDNPLRIDVENRTLDVVWREKHLYGPTSINGYERKSKQEKFHTQPSTLRRERYSFDDVYTGPDASQRLMAYSKRRVKTSLLNSRGIVFLCLAGGDFGTNPTAYLEPPMSVILGDCGGHGLISSVLDEIFRHKYKHLQSASSSPRPSPYGSVRASSPLAASLPSQPSTPTGSSLIPNEYVLFTAVIVCHGEIIDLLGSTQSKSSNNLKQPKIILKSNGMACLSHVTRLQLRSVADFERIAGVLLGRRAALREIIASIQSINLSMNEIALPDIPWLLSAEQEACILFSLSTTGEGISKSSHRNMINYHFTCPCGKYWGLPGSEICLLAEAISGLPHTPPPSLYEAGEITKLLVDPVAPDMDYVTVAAVGNQRRDGSKPSVEEDEEMIQNALQSFRVVSQLSSVT